MLQNCSLFSVLKNYQAISKTLTLRGVDKSNTLGVASLSFPFKDKFIRGNELEVWRINCHKSTERFLSRASAVDFFSRKSKCVMLKSKQLLINHQLLMSWPVRDMYNQTGNDGLGADDSRMLVTVLMYNQTLYTACFTLILLLFFLIWEYGRELILVSTNGDCCHSGHQEIKLWIDILFPRLTQAHTSTATTPTFHL